MLIIAIFTKGQFGTVWDIRTIKNDSCHKRCHKTGQKEVTGNDGLRGVRRAKTAKCHKGCQKQRAQLPGRRSQGHMPST